MEHMFDHERLDCYQVALRFVSWTSSLMKEVRQKQPAGSVGEVFDHLDRASLSCLFNTAEGNGKRQRYVRARFFDDARGSATEAAACLDALVAKGVVAPERIHEGKALLRRVVEMLSRMVAMYTNTVREDDAPYGVEADADRAERTAERPRTRTTTRTRTIERNGRGRRHRCAT